MQDDRRGQPRADDPPLEIVGAWTTLYNISTAGMCIVTARVLQVGEAAKFRLKDRDRGDVWELSGEVIWVQNPVSGLNRAGIRWVEPDLATMEWLERVIRRCGDPADAER